MSLRRLLLASTSILGLSIGYRAWNELSPESLSRMANAAFRESGGLAR